MKKNLVSPFAVSMFTLLSPLANAFVIDSGNPDLKLRWDNTIKYNSSFRVRGASDELKSSINQDDGDRNFDRGLISNRFDILSEFDLTYKNIGARVSGAGWYDTVYNESNDNDSPQTANSYSRSHDEFTSDTAKLHGHKAELLDAFVYGRTAIGSTKASFRAGRHALVWGESLFYGGNGIAGGMGPIDVVKAQSVPNTQFKELIRPVQQFSGQLQITPDVSIGAYYQWRWEASQLPAAGSYFSNLDVIADGAERLIAGAPVVAGGEPLAFYRGKDMKAKNSGQGGVQLKFSAFDTDFGLYAIKYHDKTPQLYTRPGAVVDPQSGRIGEYLWVYPEDIKAYGASFSHTFGDYNIAGEVSVRRNTPLISGGAVDLTGTGDNDGNPLYAVGNSVHAQVSWLASLGPTFIANEASFLGEIAWNRRTSITKNAEVLSPNADRDATNIRVLYEPSYRQFFPGVDLSVPVGVGYGIGNSSVVGSFNGDHVGDFSIGIKATYLNDWRGGITYTHYFGPEGTFLDDNNFPSYKQSLKDRDFISLSLQRTF